MTVPEVEVRPFVTGDAEAVSKFICDTGYDHEAEAETFIQEKCVPFFLGAGPQLDRRLDLAFRGAELVGVVLHERATQFGDEGTYVRVAGVAPTFRGLVLSDGRKLSKRLIDGALYGPKRGPVFAAHARLENGPSVKLLRSYGAVPIGEPNEEGMTLFAAYLTNLA